MPQGEIFKDWCPLPERLQLVKDRVHIICCCRPKENFISSCWNEPRDKVIIIDDEHITYYDLQMMRIDYNIKVDENDAAVLYLCRWRFYAWDPYSKTVYLSQEHCNTQAVMKHV